MSDNETIQAIEGAAEAAPTPTPGPWSVHPYADEQHNIQLVAAGSWCPAIIFQNIDQPRAELEANAHLIADVVTVLSHPQFSEIKHFEFRLLEKPDLWFVIFVTGRDRKKRDILKRFQADTCAEALHLAAAWVREQAGGAS